jgi:membrane-associated phospholipid phosphatase
MPESFRLATRLFLLCIGLTLWLTQYFTINRLATNAHRRARLSTALDDLIPFIPGFIYIYLSTYLFGILPFILISDADLFISTMIGYVIVASISSTIHVVYPSQVQRRESIDGNKNSWLLIAWFQRICKPYGNFPSTHMGFSILSVCVGFIVGGPVMGSIFLFWACLIALSALFTKQHYLLDMIAGGAIGAVAAIVTALSILWI